MRKRYNETADDIQKLLDEKYNGKIKVDKKEFKNRTTKSHYFCEDHGDIYTTAKSLLYHKYGCMQCALENKGKGRTADFIKQVLDYLNTHFDGTYIVDKSTLKNSVDDAYFTCLICNTSSWKNPRTVLKGIGCGNCGHIKGSIKNKSKSIEKHIQKVKQLYKENLKVYPESISTKKEKAHYFCNLCNKDLMLFPYRVEKGFGCPECHHKEYIKNKRQKFLATIQEQVYEASEGTVTVNLDSYDGKKIDSTCLLCGHQWNPRLADLIHKKSKCPACCSTRLEKQIYDLLCSKLTLNEDFKYNTGLSDCRANDTNRSLRPDFLFLKVKLVFELDGIQHMLPLFGEEHFKRTLELDELKNEYFKNNNYILIRAITQHTKHTINKNYITIKKLKELIELAIDKNRNINLDVFKPYDFNRE